MSDKIIIKTDSLKEAIELFIELQRRHPMRSVEVYVRGSDSDER
ncbi:MAG: hypothetical protein QW576_03550 [Candidatus Korarchaeum sp.]